MHDPLALYGHKDIWVVVVVVFLFMESFTHAALGLCVIMACEVMCELETQHNSALLPPAG